MTLKSAYKSLQEHLTNLYSSTNAVELHKRINSRSIHLALLYQAIYDYKLNNPALSLSCHDAIIHMLYEDSDIVLKNLAQIPLTLALKILEGRLTKIETSGVSDFAATVVDMTLWIEKNQEWLARSHETPSDLPELKWSDLPSELFGQIPSN